MAGRQTTAVRPAPALAVVKPFDRKRPLGSIAYSPSQFVARSYA
jgi:hypothetical protein